MANFEISPERSIVVIDARSSVHPIHAECRGVRGAVELEIDADGVVDASAGPKGRLELPADRLQSGNPLYDGEMRRRIDIRRFPSISGDLLELSPGAERGRYLVQGELSFHGVTRAYEDEMTFSMLSEAVLQMRGSHVFDVRDFGVEPPKIMMLRVYPDVRVEVTLVAERTD